MRLWRLTRTGQTALDGAAMLERYTVRATRTQRLARVRFPDGHRIELIDRSGG